MIAAFSGIAVSTMALALVGCSALPSEPPHKAVLEIPPNMQLEQTLDVAAGRYRNYFVQLTAGVVAGRTPIRLQLSIVRSNVDVTPADGHWLPSVAACIESGEQLPVVCLRLIRYEERGVIAAQGFRTHPDGSPPSRTALSGKLAMDRPVDATIELNGNSVRFRLENGAMYEQLLDGRPTRLVIACSTAKCLAKATFAAVSRP
jgi:hypothetical protein